MAKTFDDDIESCNHSCYDDRKQHQQKTCYKPNEFPSSELSSKQLHLNHLITSPPGGIIFYVILLFTLLNTAGNFYKHMTEQRSGNNQCDQPSYVQLSCQQSSCPPSDSLTPLNQNTVLYYHC